MLKRTLVTAALTGLAALTLGTAANAATNGFYVGGQLGYGDSHYSSQDGANIDKTGMAGRVSLGYQFSPNFASEFGYTKFSNIKVKADDGRTSFKQYAYDLTGKGMLPFGNGFNAYGVLGASWMKLDGAGASQSRVLPTFGVGLSYDITPQLPVDVSWRRIQKTGGTDLRSADFYSVGVSYHFG